MKNYDIILLISLILILLGVIWYIKSEEIQHINNQLLEEQSLHNETKTTLQQTIDILTQTTHMLDNTTDELSKKTDELIHTYSTISNLTITKNNLLYSLQDTQEKWNNTKKDLDVFHREFNNLTKQFNALNNKSLHDPTYSEMVYFLTTDTIDQNIYNGSEYGDTYYVCSHFSRDVLHNAMLKGIRCYFVVMDLFSFFFDDVYGHAIVCFNTTDAGLIFVEPQTDDLYYNLGYLEYFDGDVILNLVIA